MKSRMLFAAVALLLPLGAQAAARPKVAAMNIKNVQGVGDGTAEILSTIVVAEVGALGRYEVIGSNEISAMIGFDRQRQMLGCAEETKCLAEIGGALGVDYLLTGQVGRIGSRYHLSMLIASTAKARVVARVSKFCNPNDDALVELAQSSIRSMFEQLEGAKAPVAESAPVKGQAPAAKTAVAANTEKSGKTAAPPAAVAEAKKVEGDAPGGAGVKAPEPAPAVSLVDTTVEKPAKRSTWLGKSLVGVGAGAAVVGVALGISAAKQYKAVDTDLGNGTLANRSDYDQRVKQIKNTSKGADVLLVVGVVSAGVGTWLWWRNAREPAPQEKPLALTPAVLPGGALLAASGTF